MLVKPLSTHYLTDTLRLSQIARDSEPALHCKELTSLRDAMWLLIAAAPELHQLMHLVNQRNGKPLVGASPEHGAPSGI